MGHSSKVATEFVGSGVSTQGSLPRVHMLAHYGTIERSNADGDRCISSVLVNDLTKGQSGATLAMEGTKPRELKKIEHGTNRE